MVRQSTQWTEGCTVQTVRPNTHPLRGHPRVHPKMHPYQRASDRGRMSEAQFTPRSIPRMSSHPGFRPPLSPPPPHLVHASQNEYKNALFTCHSECVRRWCFTERDAVMPPSVLVLSEISLPLTEVCGSDSDGELSDATASDVCDASDAAEFSHTGYLSRSAAHCACSGPREVTSMELTPGVMEEHLLQLIIAQSADDDSGDGTELTSSTEGPLLHLIDVMPPIDDSDDEERPEEEEEEGRGGMGCDTDTSDCDMVVTPPPFPGTEPTFCDLAFDNENSTASDVSDLLSGMSSDTIVDTLNNEHRDSERLQRGVSSDSGSQRRFGRALSFDCRGKALTRRPSLPMQDADQTLFERLASLAATPDDSPLHSESQREAENDS